MKILLITRWYSIIPDDGNMINDLAQTLQKQGHQVRVLCVEWKGQAVTGEYNVNEVPVWWYNQMPASWLPKPLKKPFQLLYASYGAKKEYAEHLDEFSPEAVIVCSFTAFYSGLLKYLKRRFKIPLLLILWDFFPFHHFNIRGENNKIFIKLAAKWESAQLKHCDKIGLMTPRNIEYFQKAYPAIDMSKTMVLPIWGPPAGPIAKHKNKLREQFDLPTKKVIAVFGGTLASGRGITELLNHVKTAQLETPSVFFVIIGDGPLRPKIESFIKEHQLKNISCPERLSRKDYQKFISVCDIGIVSTASNMPLIAPFPSKSIDYFRNRLTVLASVEATTDFGQILENKIKAGLASHAGKLDDFQANLKRLVKDSALRKKMGENGYKYFKTNLAVEKIAKVIIANVTKQNK